MIQINLEHETIAVQMFMMQQELPKNFDEKLKKRFVKTYKLSNHDIIKFNLLLRKSVYGYEYMDDRETPMKIL